jgi:hypothetical protein
MSNLNPLNWLQPMFLWRIIEERPNQSKLGFRQQYLHSAMAPFENVWERQVLVQRSKTQNPLAGFYSVKGQAVPATDLGYDMMLMGLQDLKSARPVDMDLYKSIVDLGESPIITAASTNLVKAKRATAMKKLTQMMAFCEDQIDTSLEYLLMHALQGSIKWPPTDDDGLEIPNPPDYWNGENYRGTWPYPLESDKIQDVTTLTDYQGNLASANARLAWTNASSLPLEAIRVIQELMLEKYATSLEGGTILMPSTTKTLLLNNTSLINWYAGSNKEQPGARQFVSDEEFRRVLTSFGDMTVRTYNSFWTYEKIEDLRNPASPTVTTRVKFLKPGKVIFLPSGGVGARFGTVPLKTGPGPNAEWRPGKFAWSYEEPKANYPFEVGMNVVAWPLFEEGHYDWFVLDVLN